MKSISEIVLGTVSISNWILRGGFRLSHGEAGQSENHEELHVEGWLSVCLPPTVPSPLTERLLYSFTSGVA